MPKQSNTTFICQNCAYESRKWLGKCPECGEWNSLVEERVVTTKKGAGRNSFRLREARAVAYSEIESQDDVRIPSGVTEFDRVLGGGIVPGTLVLLGGDPGIGKSTLLLQVADKLSANDVSVLYVSGEESERQIKLRGERLGVKAPNLLLLPETNLENIFREIERVQPGAIVVDSIQTTFSSEIESAPGSVSQIREVAAQFLLLAKNRGIPVFLIGHVTKEGSIAGPRALEHIVDTVLYFEGERHHNHRIVRATKNRFGAANEVGVFEMTNSGLAPVANPSQMFLEERPVDASSFRKQSIDPHTAVFGEVGLTGEVRGATQAPVRAREAQALGFNRIVMPASTTKGLERLLGTRVVGVRSVEDALAELF